MGKVFSSLAAELKSYNIEQRAHKVISQSKPKAAPKYESNIKDLERVLKEHPEILEETSKKSADLDERLRRVFVTSSHEIDQKRYINPDRPLPTNKEFVGFFELGYKEPASITPGKCSMKQAIQFIGDHKIHPNEWTVERIASEYKMNQDDVKNIVQYFRLFSLYLPEKGDEKERTMLRPIQEQDFNQFLADSTKKFLPGDSLDKEKKKE